MQLPPSMSTPAMSTPADSSINVHSCNVHPCIFLRQCPLLQCPSPFFSCSVNVHSCNFSQPQLTHTLCIAVRPNVTTVVLFYGIRFVTPPWYRGAEYCDQLVCLSVCLSIHEHISGNAGPIFTEFFVQIPVAVARSSSGGVALCYLLPVLWMTSRLAVVGRMTMRG